MKILLDTHTLLWLVNEHDKLSSTAKALIINDDNSLYLSVASLWEIAIKSSLGKLSGLNDGINGLLSKMKSMPIEILPISLNSLRVIEALPYVHRDPFDRILIATATVNKLTILTADSNIVKYEIDCVW